MSSYELLELFGAVVDWETGIIDIEFLPDESEVGKALRDGDPSELQLAMFQIANELAVLRAAYVPAAESDEYGSQLFLPPSKLRELADRAEQHQEARETVYAMADRPRLELIG